MHGPTCIFSANLRPFALQAKNRVGEARPPLNILFIFLDSISEFDGMVERTFPETLAATAGGGRAEFRFKRFQTVRTWTDPNFFAGMSGNQLCAVQPCARQATCREAQACGEGKAAKRPGGKELYKGYDNYPNTPFLPPRPLPKDFNFYDGAKCPECLWNALEQHGYVSAVAFDKGSEGERTPSVFGFLQRNKDRDVRHLYQQAAGKLSCSPGGNAITGSMVDYIGSAFDAYPDVPLFAHIHSIVAHDEGKNPSARFRPPETVAGA
jgi:hypothetical protein